MGKGQIRKTVSTIIERFGEDVTITPYLGTEYEDNNVYTQERGFDDDSSFSQKARVYSTITKRQMEEMGFTKDGSVTMYFDEDVINEGDKVEFDDHEYVIVEKRQKQLGGQGYVWMVSCRRAER